jgi:hypothetical protein
MCLRILRIIFGYKGESERPGFTITEQIAKNIALGLWCYVKQRKSKSNLSSITP